MKVLLESAALDSIRWALTTHLADGVFVTPAALDADAFGIDAPTQVDSIAKIAASPVIVTVGAVSADDLHKQSKALAKIADQIIVAIPFVDDGLVAMTRLATEGIRFAATFIVTPAQALLAANVGAAFVSIGVQELEAIGHDPRQTLRETSAMFDRHGIECDVLATGATSSRLVTDALTEGADAVAVTVDTLRVMMQHPLTDRSVDQMLGALSRRPRGRKR